MSALRILLFLIAVIYCVPLAAQSAFTFNKDCVASFFSATFPSGGQQSMPEALSSEDAKALVAEATSPTTDTLQFFRRRIPGQGTQTLYTAGCDKSNILVGVYTKEQIDGLLKMKQEDIDSLPTKLQGLVNDALKTDVLTADRISNAVLQVQEQIKGSILRASNAEITTLKARVATLEAKLEALEKSSDGAQNIKPAPAKPDPAKTAPAKPVPAK